MKDYDDPVELLALRAVGLLEASELELADAALAQSPELAARMRDAVSALEPGAAVAEHDEQSATGQVGPGPALPDFAALSEKLDAVDASPADLKADTLGAALADEDAMARAGAGPELLIRLSCTYCHDMIARSEATYCAGCLAPHHGDCFTAHGSCSAPGCAEVQVVRAATHAGAPQAESAPQAARPTRRVWQPLAAAVAAALIGGVAAWSFNATRGTQPSLLAGRVPPPATSPAPTPLASASADPREGARWIARGLRLQAKGDGKGALAAFTQAVEVATYPHRAYVRRAVLRRQLGDSEPALEDLREVLDLFADPQARELPDDLRWDEVRHEALRTLARLHDERLDYDLSEAALRALEREGAAGTLRDELLLLRADAVDPQASEADLRARRLWRELTSSEDPRWPLALSYAARHGNAEVLKRLCDLDPGPTSIGRAYEALLRVRNHDLSGARGLLGGVKATPAQRLIVRAVLAQAAADADVDRLRNELQGLPSDSGPVGRGYREGLRLAKLAERSLRSDLYLKARRQLIRVNALHPLFVDALVARSRLHYAWGDPSVALSLAERAVALDPGSALAHEWMGFVELRTRRKGDDDERARAMAAVAAFNRAIACSPTGTRSHRRFGPAHARYGRGLAHQALAAATASKDGAERLLRLAREDLREAVRLTPNRYPETTAEQVRRSILYTRALLQFERDAGGSAAEVKRLEAGLERTVDLAQSAAAGLARSLVNPPAGVTLLPFRAPTDDRGNTGGMRRLDDAVTLHPESAELREIRGVALLQTGHMIAGVLDLASAGELDPQRHPTLMSKVYQISYVAELDLIHKELEALRNHPRKRNAVALLAAAFVYFTQVDKDPAAKAQHQVQLKAELKHLDALIQRAPSATAHYTRALLREAVGEARGARDDLRVTLALDPHHKAAKAQLSRLEDAALPANPARDKHVKGCPSDVEFVSLTWSGLTYYVCQQCGYQTRKKPAARAQWHAPFCQERAVLVRTTLDGVAYDQCPACERLAPARAIPKRASERR